MMTEITEGSLMVMGPRRRGRKLRAEARSRPRTVWLSPGELERIEKAAKVNRQRPSDFMRDGILAATEDCLESPPSGKLPNR